MKSILSDIKIISALIILNALFVAVEFAIVKVRISEIETDEDVKDTLKRKTLRIVKDNLDKYVSAAQLGITLINVLLGWIGEQSLSKFFLPLVNMTGLAPNINSTLASICGVLVITFVTVVFSEQAPKMIAIQYPMQPAEARKRNRNAIVILRMNSDTLEQYVLRSFILGFE